MLGHPTIAMRANLTMFDSSLTVFRASGIVLVFASLGAELRASSTATDKLLSTTLESPSPSWPVSSLPLLTWPDAPQGVSRAGSRERFDRPLVQTEEKGTVWVRGANYKASFSEAGTTFIPYFGAQAPANHPVTLRVREIEVGGEQLAFDATTQPLANDATMDYARGSFLERYECGPLGIEQLFVFENLPTRGEIRLNVTVESDLVLRPAEEGFVLESDLGHVAYGRAIAIDAEGRRADVASRIENGSIELVLSADFVAHARLPLVIDPLISTFAIATTPSEDFDSDVAYDAATGHWMITYEETFSATDHDVWAEIRDANGAFVAGNYADFTTDYWSHPRVAGNALAQGFLVVAAVGQPAGGSRIVRGRIATASNAVFGAAFTISGSESGEQINPDVGGDPLLVAPTYFCVVWERVVDATNHDVFARLVRGDGTLLGSGTILLDASLTTLDSVPAISKSDGGAPFATQQWSVVWHRATGFPDFGDIFGAQIHWDGTITHTTFPINVGEEDVYQPEVSSLLDGATGTRSYMVAYSSFDPYFATGFNVAGSIVNGTSVLGTSDLHSQVDLTTISRDQQQPSVDSDGQHFAVTYAQRSPTGTSNDDVLFADVLASGSSPRVCESGLVAGALAREFNARIASAHAGGGAAQRYMLTWDSTDIAGGGTADVYGSLYDGGLGGCVLAQCFGDGSGLTCPCSNNGSVGNGCASSVSAAGANLTWSGNPRVSADTFVLIGTSMPNSSCLYFQGSSVVSGGNGSVFGDGLRCAGGTVIRLGTKTNSAGASQYPVGADPTISVRCSIPASGQVRWYQVWYRNAAAFCTASTFNLSNALRVVWAP